jgi:hypothetical protein
MNAIEARSLSAMANSIPTESSYIDEIDAIIETKADEGGYSVFTNTMKWPLVIKLARHYKNQGFVVSRHNTTKSDQSPYEAGHLTISWRE